MSAYVGCIELKSRAEQEQLAAQLGIPVECAFPIVKLEETNPLPAAYWGALKHL
jgi:hypothetical protein